MASSNGNPRSLSTKRRSNSSPELQIHGMDCQETQELSLLLKPTATGVEVEDKPGPSSSSADNVNSHGPVPQICLEHLRALPRSDGYIGPEFNDNASKLESDQEKCDKDIQVQCTSPSTDKENTPPSASLRPDNLKSQSKRRQSGLSRMASVIVSKFYSSRERPKKVEKQDSKETDSESSSDNAESPSLQRGRSKSLSGRILRRFRDASRERNGDERTSTPKRRQSHRETTTTGSERTGNQTRTHTRRRYTRTLRTPIINFAEFDPQLYPTECEEDIQRAIRQKEIQEGVDPPPGFQSQYFDDDKTSASSDTSPCPPIVQKPRTRSPQLASLPIPKDPSVAPYPQLSKVVPDEMKEELIGPTCCHSAAATVVTTSTSASTSEATYMTPQAHTQVDYMHCLVPDQQGIMNSCFYWGKIDRYEADEILENKPEGTFLLRDSSQEEFLFSVSFRRYGRTLHARIEQWNHKFSFDAHDPSVYSCDTICGLLEHYKDPNYCMFFEPMLTIPLPRTNPPSLQELARSVICSQTTYDGVHFLELPRVLKDYLKEYHYKQRVRVRQINNHPETQEKAPSPKFVYKNVSNTCISR